MLSVHGVMTHPVYFGSCTVSRDNSTTSSGLENSVKYTVYDNNNKYIK